MPWASDKQRAWMFATHPAMAHRWAAEEKKGPTIGPAKAFDDLLRDGLIGISDQVLRDHVALYQRYCAELAMLDEERRSPTLMPPPTMSPAELHLILAAPVRTLSLEQISGPLADAIAVVEGELEDKGITWRPLWYVGDSDFWTADRGNSINLPWFLATAQLWDLVNGSYLRYSVEDVVRILRHETGHALGYAYELWKMGRWEVTFGDFNAPYRDDFTPDPSRAADFVTNIAANGSAPLAHYAQKHPDEDWAETFAVWLDEGSRWRETYADRPVALAKLEAIEDMIVKQGATYGTPPNRHVGRRVSYRTLDFTVADFIGVRQTPDPVDSIWRRQPEVYAAVVLHELYFAALARGGGPPAAPAAVAAPAFMQLVNGFDAWAADLRIAARAATGWVLTVWDRRDQRIRNVLVAEHSQGVPPNADVLLALDVHEHAYAGDVGIRRDLYVAAWWRNINWSVIEARTRAVLPSQLPQLWGVTYAMPNVDGSRKACVNCRFARAAATRCGIVIGPIAPDMVCGYHVEFEKRLPGDLAGLELVSDGTSCDRCRFYSPISERMGQCYGVAGPGGVPPALVDARGCCARWEQGLVPPAALLRVEAPAPVPTAAVEIAAAAPAPEAAAPLPNARILPTP